MITRAEVEKLGAMHAVESAILSLYLAVPSDPSELNGLADHAGELVAAAKAMAGASDCLRDEDRKAVMQKLAAGGRDWLGQTVAIFASADAGLLEALPLPCRLPERAVLATRPHIRPLLVALQRCPAYRVAVVDQWLAWLFAIAADEIETVPEAAVAISGDGTTTWRRLGTHRAQQRIVQLAGHRYHHATAILEQVMGPDERQPLVVGGHDDGICQLLTELPPTVREGFAGGFTADAATLTPAQVRDLAAPVIARWAEQRARREADEIVATPPGGLAAIGLPACLAAVNAGAVETLVVPDDGLVPGYECGRCGVLSTDADGCPDWGTAPLPVQDVVEEMVARTLEDGGQTLVISDASAPMAARLHFPLTR